MDSQNAMIRSPLVPTPFSENIEEGGDKTLDVERDSNSISSYDNLPYETLCCAEGISHRRSSIILDPRGSLHPIKKRKFTFAVWDQYFGWCWIRNCTEYIEGKR